MRTSYDRRLIPIATGFAMMLCLYSSVEAQEPKRNPPGAAQPAEDGPNEAYILRTYEVGDLVMNVQDHPYRDDTLQLRSGQWDGGGSGGGGGGGFGGGGMGGGGGGFFSVPDDGVRRTQASLQSAGGETARILLCQIGGGGKGNAREQPPTKTKTSAPSAGTAITLDDLVNVLVNTVAYDSWAENGGGEGRIETLGTVLIISQKPAVHERISNLLRALKDTLGRRRTLTIDARWLQLNSNELDELIVKDSSDPPIVERKPLVDLTRRAGSIRGITNCFSGQLVYLVSGTKRNVVSGFVPVVGAIENPRQSETLVALRSRPQIRLVADTTSFPKREASVGYQPIVVTPNFGALLEIRATSTAGAKSDVVVELKSTLTAATDSRDDAPRRAPADVVAPSIDRVAIETQELATTLRVPFGKPVLVGGLTNVPGSVQATEAGQAKERPQTYLVLEIR